MVRAEPPRLLQIHRETVIPGADQADHAIESDTARRCSSLGCPHAYLALQADLSRGVPWTLGDGRFLVVTASSTTRTFLGTVFDTPDGMRFDIRAASTLADAEAARIADPPSRVLAIRPSWSFPAPEWITADPVLWKGVDRSP